MATELVTADFHAAALAFPDKVKSSLAALDTPAKAAKALRGGDGLLRYAKDLDATKEEIDAIQEGRLHIIARLGTLLPAEQGKRNDKLPVADAGSLRFNSHTLSAYRKVAKHQDKISEYIAAKRDDDEPISTRGLIDWVGAGGVMATRHGNEIIEWYTPAKYVDMARKVMGGIDLDPATSNFAQKTVKAKTYFIAKDDGLARNWTGRVFLNPPFKQPLGKQFTAKLCAEVEAKNVTQAVLLTNDQTDTDWWHQVAGLAAAVCFLNGRIGFYNEAGETSSPTNGQTFCYFGNRTATFAAVFGSVGLCMRAYR